MLSITVDTLEFSFPNNWIVTKYDEWGFYRNQFVKMRDGIKSVDLIALDPQKTVWFIEAKDFRLYKRVKEGDIDKEVWDKVYDTLAGILPASLSADTNEKNIAKQILQCEKLRVVFQCEQPKKHSKLFPQSFNLSDVQKKMKVTFKAIDPHAIIVSKDNMPSSIQWTVKSSLSSSFPPKKII